MAGSGPLASLPSLAVEISFTPPYSTPSWVNITDWVTGFTTTSGRQHEQNQINSSTAKITLTNLDGRFFPWNTGSPYWGVGGTGLVPEMPIQITATWDTVTYPVFYGYIDSWVPSWKDAAVTTMTVSATDILGLLAVNDLNLTYYESLVLADSPLGYWTLGDTPGSDVALDSSGNGYTGTFTVDSGGGSITFGEPGAITTSIANSALFESAAADGGANIILPSMFPGSNVPGVTIEFWFMSTDDGTDGGLTGVGGVLCTMAGNVCYIDCLVGGPNSPYVGISDNVLTDADAGVSLFNSGWHHVVGTVAAAGPFTTYVDGVQVATAAHAPTAYSVGWSTPPPPNEIVGGNLSPGSFLQHVAIYDTVLTSTQVLTHYNAGSVGDAVQYSGQLIDSVLTAAGVPPGLLSIATGISEIQPLEAGSTLAGTEVLSFLQQVNGTENGLLWQAPDGVLTFVDRHTAITGYLTSQATFEDSPTSTNFYLIDGFVPGVDNIDLWNEVIAAAQENSALGVVGISQAYENTASQNQYGKRTYPNAPTLLCTTDAEALYYAQYVGTLYSSPLTRIQSVKLSSTAVSSAGAPGVNLPAMLGLALWDQTTVVYNGVLNTSPLSQIGIIEGVEHAYNANPGTWTTVFRLSPAGVSVSWFILDNATFGTLSEGNVLAY